MQGHWSPYRTFRLWTAAAPARGGSNPNRLGQDLLDSSSDAGLILADWRGPLDLMRFRLVYDGELKAAGNNSPRGPEKWAIRKAIHPQLCSLSATHPVMRGVALTMQPYADGMLVVTAKPPSVDVDVTSPHGKTQDALLESVDIGGQAFIPLVRKSFALVCELDILFLRNDAPGSVIKSGGDLDNRIKTLFDGLRLPTKTELKGMGAVPTPFRCLLENDDLISSFTVRTDRLLTDPNPSPERVMLVIEVKLIAVRLTAQNVGFLAD